MAITAAMVKELREMTGAGMMDCKKALNEVDGDMDKAVEFLREKGLAAAAKKASRIAAEGIVATLVSDGIDIFIDRLQEKAESNEYLNKLQQDDKYEEVKEALNVGEYNMIVTPKEIDDLIENMKDIVARGINFAI